MAELTLLVNSTDTALLNGSAVSPVVPNSTVAGSTRVEGFAGVLSKQVAPGEGAGAAQSSPQNVKIQNEEVPTNGELPPLNGKTLPLTAIQNTPHGKSQYPELNASLLSAIAQANPALTEQSESGAGNNMPLLPTDSLLARTDAGVQLILPQPALAQVLGTGGAVTQMPKPDSPLVLNPQQTANLPSIKMADPNTAAALTNTTRDTQHAVLTSAVPALLGKPVSTTAEQALARIRRTTSGVNSTRAESLLNTRMATESTQSNDFSRLSAGMNNLMGSTARIDIFNTALGVAAYGRAEQRLLTSPAPVALTAGGLLSDSAVNLFADAPRLPVTTGTGLSPTLAVTTPVGQPSWGSEMGQRVIWLANSELREAQLQLHPRNLGTVDVRIAYGPEQQLNVSFNVTNAIARDALEASLPRLREMFEQQGLNLADANISQESPQGDERQNDMDAELSAQATLQANNDEPLEGIAEQQNSLDWLSEGLLDAYA